MAALTSAGVTVNRSWQEGNPNGRKFKAVDVTLVLSSQGGATNNIPAALFGMTEIVDATGFRDSAGAHVQAMPSYTGALLTFCTEATAGTPADQTATVRGIVKGV